MTYRIFGGIFLIAALALGVFAARDFLTPAPWTVANPAKRIRMLVEKDVRGLPQEESLPPEWSQISKTSYRFESYVTKALMAEERPSFNFAKKAPSKKVSPTKSEAAAPSEAEKEYELEIDVLDLPDETEPGFIFQMSLFESKTKNKIYEIGRTYHWSSLNQDHL